MDRIAPERKTCSMTLLLLALLAAIALATGFVLADSGLRLWSALGGIRAARAGYCDQILRVPAHRPRSAARVTTRVSFARPIPARLRAAA